MTNLATIVKSPKVLITGALLLAFAVGAVFEGYTKFGTTNASPATTSALVPGATANAAQPAVMTAAPPAGTVRTVYAAPRPVHHKRSWEKEALIIGGSSAAGAGIGAIAGGGKGAGIGAASGGVAGLVYDLATRNK